MSDKALIVGGLVVAYMLMQRNAVASTVPKGAVASMPANVGNGWQQIAQGALSGFLQSIASGPVNNTSTTVFPSNSDWVNRSGIVQEAVSNAPATMDDYIGSGYMDGWYA